MDLLSTKVAYAASANFTEFLTNVNREIINPLISFLFALALVYFLYGMFQFIASGASDEKKTSGKSHMLWGVIGLSIMLGVWFILGVVLDTFSLGEGINLEQGTVNLPD
ncbi:MAG: hypothetical protein AAB933_02120 [Patescibacteria group bacterium]